MEFFNRFNLKKEFLELDPSCWSNDENYCKNKNVLKSLRVVNDVSERAVRLVTDYCTCLTKDEEQKQFLFRTVAEYKRSNPDSKKESLVKRYKKSVDEN